MNAVIFIVFSLFQFSEVVSENKDDALLLLSKLIIPSMDGKTKGEAGKICVIGGSTEYTGAPYFSAITALKVGADIVYVITTENAAPVIKTYSPELIVYPFLNYVYLSKIVSLLNKMDVIVIGPGLGREPETLVLLYEIISACRSLQKPLVIDADGLYAISKNVTVIKDYPKPGIILTPNHHETRKLKEASAVFNDKWYNYWGDQINILIKGQEDQYYCSDDCCTWSISAGGSGRRAGGQGDILSGALGTFLNWALKSKEIDNADICRNKTIFSAPIARSVAGYAASIFTRKCNNLAFGLYGRSMTASDMINNIHIAFQELFGN